MLVAIVAMVSSLHHLLQNSAQINENACNVSEFLESRLSKRCLTFKLIILFCLLQYGKKNSKEVSEIDEKLHASNLHESSTVIRRRVVRLLKNNLQITSASF